MWVAFGGNTTREDFIMLVGDYSKDDLIRENNGLRIKMGVLE